MSNSAMTLYKLMILYMLSNVEYSVTNAGISDFMLLKDYASYFNLQTALSELAAQGLIKSETIRNSSYFEATDEGRETLSLLSGELSLSIKNDIKKYLSENSVKLRNELTAIASYIINGSGDCVVSLRINEYESNLLNLSMIVPSEEKAEEICKSWKENYNKIYSSLFNSLVFNKDPL